MGEKKRNGLHGKVFVSALAVFSLTCSNVVAKAADIPVNMMCSNNVQVAKLGEFEEIQIDEMRTDLEFKGKNPSDLGNFVKFDVRDTEDTTYEIIYNDNIKNKVEQMQNQIEPQHVHKIVDITLKEHKKNSDWTIVNKKDTIFKYIFWERLDSLPIPESCFHFVWCQIA